MRNILLLLSVVFVCSGCAAIKSSLDTEKTPEERAERHKKEVPPDPQLTGALTGIEKEYMDAMHRQQELDHKKNRKSVFGF